MLYYVEDSADARRNIVTLAGCDGGGPVAYNAVLKVDFSDEAATEPVTPQEAKDWCRIDVTDDDALITRLIKGARKVCETYVNLSFITRTVTATIHNGLGNFTLPYGPVVGEVTSYADTDGIAITDYNYRDAHDSDITVVYDAGYETLPEDLRTALLCQIAWMYENRGDSKIAMGLSLETTLILKPLRSV